MQNLLAHFYKNLSKTATGTQKTMRWYQKLAKNHVLILLMLLFNKNLGAFLWNIKFNSLIYPQSLSMYLKTRLAYLSISQQENTISIRNRMKTNTNIVSVGTAAWILFTSLIKLHFSEWRLINDYLESTLDAVLLRKKNEQLYFPVGCCKCERIV